MANFNLNKSILGGRLTADPELKQTASRLSACTFTIAVNRRYSKDGQQEADFINCVAWRQTAEFICKYFKKGSSICISGAIQVRSWNDAQGNKRYATEVVADEAYFVESKVDSEPNSKGSYNPYATQSPQFEEIPTDATLPF